ncbi:MAG: bacteriohemerythrin [Treponema sp.]|jgi:hemerythrin-like metal-binding protein|nr:bacteriohemerythrin [Treponema sp.]
MGDRRLDDRRKGPRRKSDRRKRVVLLLVAMFGFILLNISVGLNLLSGPLPKIIIFMGMGFPMLVTIVIFLILIERIREIRFEESIDFSNYSILVAESNIVNREILNAILEKTGIEIDYAEDGNAVVSMFKDDPEKYSIVFMDAHLPEMNGFDAARAIRSMESEEARDVPIIALITGISKESIDKSKASGMNDHIEKPFNPDSLYFMIKKYTLYFQRSKTKQKWEHGIAWDESFALGDELVDSQHHQLFGLVSSLVTACEDGTDNIKLNEILDFLVNYTVQHFNDEEALMTAINYSGFKAHKKKHEDFKVTVGELVEKFAESGSSAELRSDIIRIVVKWLIEHIIHDDKKIVTSKFR